MCYFVLCYTQNLTYEGAMLLKDVSNYNHLLQYNFFCISDVLLAFKVLLLSGMDENNSLIKNLLCGSQTCSQTPFCFHVFVPVAIAYSL